jgi:hypothetical protein
MYRAAGIAEAAAPKGGEDILHQNGYQSKDAKITFRFGMHSLSPTNLC